jgi:predicted amidophosphoribosyltransferase
MELLLLLVGLGVLVLGLRLLRRRHGHTIACPSCAKAIRATANVCRLCHRVLSTAPVNDVTYG